MPTTIYSNASDGHVRCISDVSYANARDGTGIVFTDNASAAFDVGQSLEEVIEFWVYEGFLNFDVSALAGEDVEAATLSLWLVQAALETDFTLQVRNRDWGDTLEDADFVPGGNLAALPLLASIGTSGLGVGAYHALTSEPALLDAIEAAAAGDGILRLILCSDRTVAGTEPTGNEYVILSSADESGTTQDPRLVVFDPALQPRFDLTSQQPIFVPVYGIVQHQSSTAEFVSTGD